MGQKVNPVSLRLGITQTWKSTWFVDPKKYADVLGQDLLIRRFLLGLPEVQMADLADIRIIRHPKKMTIVLSANRPGILIGAKGANIEKMIASIQKKFSIHPDIKIQEVKKPELNAQLVANNVAKQLKMRGAFRKILKNVTTNAIKNKALGIKIRIAGRLDGAEMAREFTIKEGRVPLQTLRANIDYGFAESHTTYGIIGVKTWIFHGEQLDSKVKPLGEQGV